MTRDDQVIGTPAYMSPKQIEGSSDIETRGDIYSRGSVFTNFWWGTFPSARNPIGIGVGEPLPPRC